MNKKYTQMMPAMIGIIILLFYSYKNNLKTKELYVWILLGFAMLIALYFLLQYTLSVIERKKYLKSGLCKIDKMSGAEFEKFLKAHFENLGYKVKLTPASNDYGADLIIEKDREKVAIQAKRYNGKVNNKAIQEVSGAIRYYKCSRGMVVTNSFYTKNAINLAKECEIELWDRNVLKEKFKVIDD